MGPERLVECHLVWMMVPECLVEYLLDLKALVLVVVLVVVLAVVLAVVLVVDRFELQSVQLVSMEVVRLKSF